MALTLAIENETRLPDGGPLSIRVTGRRGIDIGRDQHLDWTLPDPDRFISGKHCEVRYRDGAYWLHDVSSNGTFINGSDRRMSEPHRLRTGDRIEIGKYIVRASIDGEDEPAGFRQEPVSRPSDPVELWGVPGETAPPIPASELQPPRRAAAPIQPDFLDWVVDVPDAHPVEPVFAPAPHRSPDPRPLPRQPQRADTDHAWASHPSGAPAWEAVPPPARSYPDERDDTRWPSSGEAAGGDEREPEAPPTLPRADVPPELEPEMSFIYRLSRGAGVPEDVFAGHDPLRLAEELGVLLRLTAENLKQLLGARSESRALTRSSRQTMIEAFDNNPLKFAPTAEEALRMMFGQRTKSYLDARQTVKQSFEDLKAHQIATYAAMQQALRMLMDDLDPRTVDKETGGGFGAVVGSRRSKLWDAYLARWEDKVGRHDNGMLDAFMKYFAECYQRNAGKNR
jgi:type VI secretion system protein ImpI